MQLEQETIDGEIQIHDEDTDNRDIVCIIPLTDDEGYNEEVLVPFARIVCVAPDLLDWLECLVLDIEKIEDTTANKSVNPEKEDSYWVAGNIPATRLQSIKKLIAEARGRGLESPSERLCGDCVGRGFHGGHGTNEPPTDCGSCGGLGIIPKQKEGDAQS